MTSLDKLLNNTDADNSCTFKNLKLRPNLQVGIVHIRSVNKNHLGWDTMS